MLTRVQAFNYRCLRHIDQTLGPFQVLVGANGSGKSTFLDVPTLLRDIVRQPRGGLEAALMGRSANFDDLLFDKTLGYFELAIELAIPDEVVDRTGLFGSGSVARLQMRIGYRDTVIRILSEQLLLRQSSTESAWVADDVRRADGSLPTHDANSILEAQGFSTIDLPDQAYTVVFQQEGLAGYRHEHRSQPHLVGFHKFNLKGLNSALANLPEDAEQFPVATWVRNKLVVDQMVFAIDPKKMAMPAPVTLPFETRSDGSHLASLVESLFELSPATFADWIDHLRVAMPDIADVRTVARPEDRHHYIVVDYADGRSVPSWLLSEGTLRLMALTLPTYAMDDGIILSVEEPENCIHPLAISVVMDSLRSFYESQVLVTTHSPMVLSQTLPEEILCFSRSENGTVIVRGDQHDRLKAWNGSFDPGVLLASGILG